MSKRTLKRLLDDAGLRIGGRIGVMLYDLGGKMR